MDSRQKQDKIYKVTIDEFERSNYDAWRKTVEGQLKGAPFEKKLVKKTSENIDIQPLYSKEVSSLVDDEMPGSYPFTRGSSSTPKSPHICQQHEAPTPQQLNKMLQYNTSRGQNSVYLKFDKTSRMGGDPKNISDIGINGTAICSVEDMVRAFKGLDFTNLYLHVDAGIAGSAALALFAAAIEKLGFKTQNIKGAILCDPHNQLMLEGALNTPVEEIYSDLAEVLKIREKLFPKCALIGVDVRVVQESGGSATEELAVAFASAVEYMRALAKHDFEMDQIAPAFQFSMTSGGDFFMEIAKFRAGRKLWAQIVTSCQGDAEQAPFNINASGQHWNKTVYDPYVNMLRTTTESFAAMIGGVDSLHSVAFDEVFSVPDEFSQRIARNTQIVLNEESRANEVIDPAGGSWYIESLTDELARKAWQLFCIIEKQGGLVKALQNGFIQQTIAGIAKQKMDRIAQRKDGIIGTSLFANIYEEPPEKRKMQNDADKNSHLQAIQAYKRNRDNNIANATLNSVNKNKGYFNTLVNAARAGATLHELHKTIFTSDSSMQIKPLQKMRGAEDYEALRQASEKFKEKNGDYPAIVLATIGPVWQHKARADFSANFLAPAGFRAIESGIDSDEKKILDVVKKSSAKIVVICSTDDTYADCVPPLTRAVKEYDDTILVIVAGYPQDIIDDLKKAGIDDFLHIKSNNLKFLQQLQSKTGVS